jgi:uncharacterized protein YodC (DUF2158 family)
MADYLEIRENAFRAGAYQTAKLMLQRMEEEQPIEWFRKFVDVLKVFAEKRSGTSYMVLGVAEQDTAAWMFRHYKPKKEIEMKFPVGSIVQLKSGGPKMTVAPMIGGDSFKVWCFWFKSDGSLEEKFLYKEVLVKVEKKQTSSRDEGQ